MGIVVSTYAMLRIENLFLIPTGSVDLLAMATQRPDLFKEWVAMRRAVPKIDKVKAIN